jgi:NAD(P)-dependent dehydrogenase (short-subunit alcohol dehydrogenase family)
MSSSLLDLTGKVAIVTGAGRGLGRAIAVEFGRAGAEVVAAARTVSQIEETAAMIRDQGGKALAIPVDVLNVSRIEEMLGKTLDAFGKVDILVNNAGGLPDNMQPTFNHGYVLNLTVEDWKAEIELNLNSLFYCCKIVGEKMVRQASGNIINISSAMGMSPFPGLDAAAAARAGVINFTQTLAFEWAPYNIRANCIAPFFAETPLTNRDFQVDPGSREVVLGNIAMGRFGKPEEIAAVALFLASPGSSYVTGETIMVSGGRISGLPPGYPAYLRATRSTVGGKPR